MKYLNLIFCIFIFGIFIYCTSNNNIVNNSNSTGNIVTDDIEEITTYYDRANIYTDDDFLNILKEYKHKEHFKAPEELRTFLKSTDIFRLSFDSGYIYEEKKVSLNWWISEIAINDNASNTRNKLIVFFEEQGFDYKGIDKEIFLIFEKTNDSLYHFIRIEEPIDFTGRSNSCGTNLYYKITFPEILEAPFLLKDIYTFHPNIICSELPEKILNKLNEKPVFYIYYGGTWIQYYTLNISLMIDSEEEMNTYFDELEELILDEGFVYDGQTVSGNFMYMKDFSYIYLERNAEKDYYINFRFQPYS